MEFNPEIERELLRFADRPLYQVAKSRIDSFKESFNQLISFLSKNKIIKKEQIVIKQQRKENLCREFDNLLLRKIQDDRRKFLESTNTSPQRNDGVLADVREEANVVVSDFPQAFPNGSAISTSGPYVENQLQLIGSGEIPGTSAGTRRQEWAALSNNPVTQPSQNLHSVIASKGRDSGGTHMADSVQPYDAMEPGNVTSAPLTSNVDHPGMESEASSQDCGSIAECVCSFIMTNRQMELALTDARGAINEIEKVVTSSNDQININTPAMSSLNKLKAAFGHLENYKEVIQRTSQQVCLLLENPRNERTI